MKALFLLFLQLLVAAAPAQVHNYTSKWMTQQSITDAGLIISTNPNADTFSGVPLLCVSTLADLKISNPVLQGCHIAIPRPVPQELQ